MSALLTLLSRVSGSEGLGNRVAVLLLLSPHRQREYGSLPFSASPHSLCVYIYILGSHNFLYVIANYKFRKADIRIYLHRLFAVSGCLGGCLAALLGNSVEKGCERS